MGIFARYTASSRLNLKQHALRNSLRIRRCFSVWSLGPDHDLPGPYLSPIVLASILTGDFAQECCEICRPYDTASIEYENCTGNCEVYACSGVVQRCEEFWE